MTEGIHHINGTTIDPWGYATMSETDLLAASNDLIDRISND